MEEARAKQYPDKTIRYIVLFDELIILIGLMLFLGHFFWGLSPFDLSRAYKRIIVMCSLCYVICNMHVGVVLHKRFVRADLVFRSALLNQFYFMLLSLAVMWSLKSPVFSPSYLIPFYLAMLIGSLLHRLALRKIVKFFRAKGRNTRSAIFIGSPMNAEQLFNAMINDPTTGFRVTGYFDKTPDARLQEKSPFLGTYEQILPFLEKNHKRVHHLYCTLPAESSEEFKPIIEFCDNHLIHFFSIPLVHSFTRHTMSFEIVGGTILLSHRYEPLSLMENRLVKRIFDITVSAVFLLTFFPLIYLFIGIAIKLTSPGPILFRQKRNGENGKEFWCYKFRSMRVNAESDTLQATEHDPRKTRLGNFMRKTNIDELPQFINVLKGDMSIVGPRPHMVRHTEEYSTKVDKYMVRHFVKPGVTGWAQIKGFRGETKELWQMEGRVEKDIWYIEHWSFSLDLYIILKTITNIIKGEENAY